MKLTWYGHACFLLETEQGSIVFDPYSPGSVPGLALPPFQADAVICSHGHGDHNFESGVSLTGNSHHLKVRKLPCYHDGQKGKLRGDNLITVVEAEGLTLVHLGDLGHLLSEEQIRDIGRVDFLLIPVGGYYTIDAAQAKEVVDQLKPNTVVPMHYRKGTASYPEISELQPFLDQMTGWDQVLLEEDSIELVPAESHQILVFPWPR